MNMTRAMEIVSLKNKADVRFNGSGFHYPPGGKIEKRLNVEPFYSISAFSFL